MSSIPWTEAYRPTNFDNIVLEPLNKKILKNIRNIKIIINTFV